MTNQNIESILVVLSLLQISTLILVLLLFKPSTGSKKSKKKQIVLDTSAVIDGRALSLAEAGFLNDTELISTNIILDELQYMADEGDSFKRSKARYGLEVLNKLSTLKNISLITINLSKSEHQVDQQLLNLSKKLGAQLFTADFNLAQRAKVEGVEILSPNSLAEALKPQILPGENFKIKLIQKGDDRGQAVGYLQDGTMVVAENCQNKIGQTIELKSSKIIQTAGGRIIFAQPVSPVRSQKQSSQRPPQPKPSNPRPPKKLTKEDSLINAINSSK